MKDLKIGCVPYLNSKPFIGGLDVEKITFLPPSQLAPELHGGRLDIALVPIFECLLHPEYRILEGLSISSKGQVKSVILLHDCPVKEVRTIAADSDSLTSIHLLKVLLATHWKVAPEILPEGTKADAMLWIGDRALQYREELSEYTCTDLGQAWFDFTGLPFVFAAWAISPRSQAKMETIEEFRRLCINSIEQRHRFATTPDELEYFTRYIQYGLGESEKKGILRFREELSKLGLISEIKKPLDFIPVVCSN